jgi:hypothetical protein
MSQNMGLEGAIMPVTSAGHAQRVAALKRAFQRQLGRRPTMIERTSMERAARLVARAEAATVDPNVAVEHVISLTNLARRAEVAVYDLIGWPERRPPPAVRDMGVSVTDQIAQRLAALDAEREQESAG